MRPTLKEGGPQLRSMRTVVKRAAAQTIPTAGANIIWDGIVTDPMGAFTTDGYLHAPVRGWYNIWATVTWTYNATGVRRIQVQAPSYAGGAPHFAQNQQQATNDPGGNVVSQQAWVNNVLLDAGALVQPSVYQTSGASLDILSTYTFGSLELVRAV